jgi:hypothetical protein
MQSCNVEVGVLTSIYPFSRDERIKHRPLSEGAIAVSISGDEDHRFGPAAQRFREDAAGGRENDASRIVDSAVHDGPRAGSGALGETGEDPSIRAYGEVRVTTRDQAARIRYRPGVPVRRRAFKAARLGGGAIGTDPGVPGAGRAVAVRAAGATGALLPAVFNGARRCAVTAPGNRCATMVDESSSPGVEGRCSAALPAESPVAKSATANRTAILFNDGSPGVDWQHNAFFPVRSVSGRGKIAPVA